MYPSTPPASRFGSPVRSSRTRQASVSSLHFCPVVFLWSAEWRFFFAAVLSCLDALVRPIHPSTRRLNAQWSRSFGRHHVLSSVIRTREGFQELLSRIAHQPHRGGIPSMGGVTGSRANPARRQGRLGHAHNGYRHHHQALNSISVRSFFWSSARVDAPPLSHQNHLARRPSSPHVRRRSRAL
jgi:hypothetical protein